MRLNSVFTIILLVTVSSQTLLFPQNLGASHPMGLVSISSGNSLVVQNNEGVQNYTTSSIPNTGLALKNADVVQTGPGNYVEIQLDPSGAFVKLVENSSVVFNDLGTSARPAILTLLYGRMRIANTVGGGTVTIQAGNIALEFSRGDIALDFGVLPSSSSRQPMLQVSLLSGTAIVVPAVASLGSGGNRFTLYEHETVSLDVTQAQPVVHRQALSQEVVSFWSLNGFRHSAPSSTYMASAPRPSALPALGAASSSMTSSSSSSSSSSSFGYDTYLSGTPSSYGLPSSVSGGSFGQYDAGGAVNMSNLSELGDDKTTIIVKNTGVIVGLVLALVSAGIFTLAYFGDKIGMEPESQQQMVFLGWVPTLVSVFTLAGTAGYLHRFGRDKANY